MQIGLVEAKRIDEAWPHVVEWIDSAFEYSIHNEMNSGELYVEIRKGRYLLLVVGDLDGPIERRLRGCAVLGLSDKDSGRPLVSMMAVGGVDVETWLDLLFATVKGIAVHANARRIIAMGRPGWVRKMARFNVKHRASVFAYDLTAQDLLGDREMQGSA